MWITESTESKGYTNINGGCQVIQIDRWKPTTSMCNSCGTRQTLTLNERVFHCECGFVMDRDQNVALNILRAGASTHDLEVVRRETASAETRRPV